MYFLSKLFKNIDYKFVGRGGLLYFDGNDEYMISSDNYIPNKSSKSGYAVAIYISYIRRKKHDNGLTDLQRLKIANDIKVLLIKDKIVVDMV